MKFITRFLIPVCTLLAGLMCGACSDDDKQIEDLPEAPYLTVSETVFGDVGVDDVTLYTTVASSRTVTVRSSDEWCEAELLADTEKDNLRLTFSVSAIVSYVSLSTMWKESSIVPRSSLLEK